MWAQLVFFKMARQTAHIFCSNSSYYGAPMEGLSGGTLGVFIMYLLCLLCLGVEEGDALVVSKPTFDFSAAALQNVAALWVLLVLKQQPMNPIRSNVCLYSI